MVCFSVCNGRLYLADAHFSFGKFQRRDPAVSSVFAITHSHTPQLGRPATGPCGAQAALAACRLKVIFRWFTMQLLLFNCEAVKSPTPSSQLVYSFIPCNLRCKWPLICSGKLENSQIHRREGLNPLTV